MTDRIRFHLDENVDPAIADGLRRRGVDVTTTQEAGLLRSSDEEQLAFVISEGRILVTHDEDFLARAKRGTNQRRHRLLPSRIAVDRSNDRRPAPDPRLSQFRRHAESRGVSLI
jgi:uncharacterized protein with PIN domain